MQARDCARRVVLAAAVAGVALPVAVHAAPTVSEELARCALLAAAEERLACYDALNCAAVTNAEERLACYDALAKTHSARPPATPAVPAAPVPAAPVTAAPVSAVTSDGATGAASFGAVERKSPPKPQGPDRIQATVSEVSVDRLGTVSVSLDNGQVWTFHDPDARLKSGDLVTIRRAAFGSFLMTTPARHSYRVQRAQ